MSKEKVERYKQEKANRKENLEKEKKKKFWTKVGCWVALVAVIASIGTAIGVSAHNSYKNYLAALPDYDRDYLVLSDLVGINETETETEAE